jgi:hypothetical protein
MVYAFIGLFVLPPIIHIIMTILLARYVEALIDPLKQAGITCSNSKTDENC